MCIGREDSILLCRVTDSLRSRRERIAWGVSPRNRGISNRTPERAKDLRVTAAAHFTGCVDGAHSPGADAYACFAG